MTNSPAGVRGEDARDDERWPFLRYVLICLVAIGAVVVSDLLDGSVFALDVDDLLRELQIRRFVDGAGWFDRSLPSIRMPEIYVAPWSRLVDLPYALLAAALRPVLGPEAALSVAFHLWPPMLGMLYALVLVAALRQIAPAKRELPVALPIIMPVLAIFSIWEFSPGRIDHHNVQILLLAVLAYGIARWDRRGGALAGLATALSLAVGLETLPVLATALAAISIAWILGARGSSVVLASLGAGCAVSVVALALLLIEPSHYLLAETDTFSAPYVAALCGFGAISALLARWLGEDGAVAFRALAFTLSQVALLAAVLMVFPVMLDGPMPMLDGLARTYWFGRVGLERSIFYLFEVRDMRTVVQFVLVFFVMACAAPVAARGMWRGKPVLAILFAIAVTALAMSVVSTRFLRIASGLVPLLLPAAFEYLRSTEFERRGKAAVVCCFAVMMFGAAARMHIVPPERAQLDAFDYFVRNDCKDGDFGALEGLSGRMMTSPGLGIEIAHRRLPGLTVSAIPFHRASHAMSDVIEVAMAPTAQKKRLLLNNFDYFAFCRAPENLPNDQMLPLIADLQSGKRVPGLTPIGGGSSIMVFRIDHAALR